MAGGAGTPVAGVARLHAEAVISLLDDAVPSMLDDIERHCPDVPAAPRGAVETAVHDLDFLRLDTGEDDIVPIKDVN